MNSGTENCSVGNLLKGMFPLLMLWGVSGCLGPFQAHHDNSDIAQLQHLITVQQQQLQELKHEVSELNERSSKESESESEESKDDSQASGSEKDSPTDAEETPKWEECEKPDFSPKVKLRGRIHVDAVTVDQSPLNKLIVGDRENATGFRRARIGAQGTIGEQVYWISEFDFASENILLNDVYIGVKQLPYLGELRWGHFREPFSLEAQTSSNDFPMIERSSINALDPARNWGVGWYYQKPNEMGTFALGGFRGGSDNLGQDVSDDNDWAITMRGTHLLWYEEITEGRWLMHMGGSFSHRETLDDLVSFRERVEARLIARSEAPLAPFINNIEIPATANQLYNLEWAWVHNSITVQAEWSATQIDQLNGPQVVLQGGYIMASYYLTGEHSNYNRSDGAFDGVKVLEPFVLLREDGFCKVGPGAWQIVGRFSYLDFDDRGIPVGDEGQLVGDRLFSYSVGLNWYLNDNTRLMFDYNYSVLDNPNFGYSVGSLYSGRFSLFW